MAISTSISNKNISDAGRTEVMRRHTRLIGALLVEDGKLSNDQIENVQQLQQDDDSLLFGEAAIKLGLVSHQDVDRALSRQFDVNYLVGGDSDVSHEVFAAYQLTGPEIETLRQLRTTLLLTHFNQNLDSHILAITSAHRRDGRSVLAANLAVMFAQLGKRTLLVDADLRNPRQHQLFGLSNRNGLSGILAKRSSTDIVENVGGLNDLFVLPAGITPPNPQELIGRSKFSLLLEEFNKEFEIVLVDTPALERYGDAQLISATAGNAIVLVRENVGQVAAIQNLVDALTLAHVNLVGSVLNKF
jgi:protein-tyrosine kinase